MTKKFKYKSIVKCEDADELNELKYFLEKIGYLLQFSMKDNDQGHYYARIGKLDVNLDGTSKWGSKIDCENAIKKYIDKFELKII